MRKRTAPEIYRFIAESAIARSAELAPNKRADMFDAIARMLPGEASKEAEMTAFAIREAELHQLTLEKIIRSEA